VNFTFSMQTARRPYIGLSGGGVPAGGTLHAGHAYWQSTITPFSAAPQRYPALPEPSLYVTPTPRDLPDIVTRPYKLLKTVGKQGQILDEGFTRTAVVGTEIGDVINNLHQDVYMEPAKDFENYRGAPDPSSRTSSAGAGSVKSAQTSLSDIGRAMSVNEPGLVASGALGWLDLNDDPMEEDAAGSMRSRNSRPNDVEMTVALRRPPAKAPTAPQRPTKKPDMLAILNSSDMVFNIDPTPIQDQLSDAMSVGKKSSTSSSSNNYTQYQYKPWEGMKSSEKVPQTAMTVYKNKGKQPAAKIPQKAKSFNNTKDPLPPFDTKNWRKAQQIWEKANMGPAPSSKKLERFWESPEYKNYKK